MGFDFADANRNRNSLCSRKAISSKRVWFDLSTPGSRNPPIRGFTLNAEAKAPWRFAFYRQFPQVVRDVSYPLLIP